MVKVVGERTFLGGEKTCGKLGGEVFIMKR